MDKGYGSDVESLFDFGLRVPNGQNRANSTLETVAAIVMGSPLGSNECVRGSWHHGLTAIAGFFADERREPWRMYACLFVCLFVLFVLFFFVLFCFVVFCFILLYFVLLSFVSLCFVSLFLEL